MGCCVWRIVGLLCLAHRWARDEGRAKELPAASTQGVEEAPKGRRAKSEKVGRPTAQAHRGPLSDSKKSHPGSPAKPNIIPSNVLD